MQKVFNIRDWAMLMGNVAGRMEEMGDVRHPIKICLERLKTELEIGKGNAIGRSLAIIACVQERKRDAECMARFRQTLNMYKLMKFEYRYKCIMEYIKEKFA